MNLTNRPTGKIDRCCQASPVSDFAKVVARADLIVDGQFQVLGMQRLALIVSSLGKKIIKVGQLVIGDAKTLHRPVKHCIKIARNQLGRRLMILKQLQTL